MYSAEQTKYELKTVLHPGETVLEYLEFFEWSQRDLARRTGITPKTISEVCNGKAAISPVTALALEKAFQRPAGFWLGLQRQYDESVARAQETDLFTQWDQWAHNFPLREMKKYRFSLPNGRSDVDTLLSFFGVSSPHSWEQVWKSANVSYRQTRRFATREESIVAWIRQVELLAREFDLAEFDEGRLRSSIEELRQLTKLKVDNIIDPVQKLCAAAGVAVVWVPELPNTGISGCARWLSDTKAVVGLTLRYKTDDQMWFTFFHEIGHILLHKNRRSFVVDNAANDLSDHVVDPEMQQYESEANRFAADTLIPPYALEEFIRRNTFTSEAIHEFAEEVGVGPGIVVGRLQHDQILKNYQGNTLKQKLAWGVQPEDDAV